MAHLLGHPGCMESLRADLRDLQAAITDVSSRAGAVLCRSWKFPGKAAAELNMAELLEFYKHTESDPEHNQHSHVVLLELVIDRLLLLLQSFTGYTELLLSGQDVLPAQAAGHSMSAGLTTRRFWSSMVKLGTSYQQLLGEKKVCGTELPQLQPTPQARSPKEKRLKDRLPELLKLTTSQGISPATFRFPACGVHGAGSDVSDSSLPSNACSMAKSTRSVPTQTSTSAPGPCDTCASAQAALRQLGHAITGICQSQNIPSALGRLQAEQENTGRRTLSTKDVNYWASEQGKDLSRIERQLQALEQQVTPLKAALVQAEKEKEELQQQMEAFSRCLQAERESQVQQKEEAERSLALKQEEHSAAVARLEQEKEELRKGAFLMEERFCALQKELAMKKVAEQELERSKATLLEELKSATVATRQVLELEEKLQLVSSQRNDLAQELSNTSKELAKEKAMVCSVRRHHEAMQAKHKVLLQHFSSLDQERWELQSSLREAVENQAKLAEQLEQSRQQSKQQLQAQQELVDMLQQEKLSLQQSVCELQTSGSKLEEQVQELQKRERLLVYYPELHIPARARFEDSGSLSKDMEQQIQANTIRIGVMQEENVRLGSALAKLKDAAEQGTLKIVPLNQLSAYLSSQHSEKAGGQDAMCQVQQPAPPSQSSKPPLGKPSVQARQRYLLHTRCLMFSPPHAQRRSPTVAHQLKINPRPSTWIP